MSRAHASEKNAIGDCDRCGFQYPLYELKKERVNEQLQSLRVCPTCWNPDHPQYKVGRRSYHDPQSLRDPRPDQSQALSREGTSIRYEFTDGMENWTETLSSIMHDSANGTFQLVWGAIFGGGVGVERSSIDSVSLSLDASVYDRVAVRMKQDWIGDSLATPSLLEPIEWLGKMRWKRSTDPGWHGTERQIFSSNVPVFTSMGDLWTVAIWELANVTDWDGTIDGVELTFFENISSMNVDYIRFEKRFR